MYQKYLLTGATGFLGRAVVDALIKDNAKIRALVKRDDSLASMLPPHVDIVYGDVFHVLVQRIHSLAAKHTEA